MREDGPGSGDGSADLDIVRTVSLTSALEAQLERLITDGELLPGDRINENRLAVRFGTSRGPLREATRSLEAKGFLQSIRNRGVYVRRIGLDEALEIYDLRAALFGLAARLSCEKLTSLLLEHLSELVAQMAVAVDADDANAYHPLNLSFHKSLVAGSQNGTLMAEYTRFVKKMQLFDGWTPVREIGLGVANAEHREILQALQDNDAERAQTLGWAHIISARDRLLTYVSENGGLTSSDGAGRS